MTWIGHQVFCSPVCSKKYWGNKQPPADPVKTRKRVHSFTAADEARFIRTTHCDWCHEPFFGDKNIDHDHRCCIVREGARVHCAYCTRGLVHSHCNLAIAFYENIEPEHPLLADYRSRFPVPRKGV